MKTIIYIRCDSLRGCNNAWRICNCLYYAGYDFWARFIYIKTQFYKTEGIAYGNDNHYFSEFLIRDDKGYNYVGWVSRNIFSPLHTRGAVYTIYVNKNNPKNAVMGNEPTLYLIPSIVFFVFVIFYLIVLALYWLM